MKTTRTGYRLNKNGAPILSIEKGAIVKTEFCGAYIKENGEYYYFERRQSKAFIYLQQ